MLCEISAWAAGQTFVYYLCVLLAHRAVTADEHVHACARMCAHAYVAFCSWWGLGGSRADVVRSSACCQLFSIAVHEQHARTGHAPVLGTRPQPGASPA